MDENAERKAVLELKRELQRVMILMNSDEEGYGEMGWDDNAIHTLRALKELKQKHSDKGLIMLKNLGIQEPPQEFLCPISGMLMTDPVTADSGQTFDHASYRKWAESNEDLSRTLLVSNCLVKKMIANWCEVSQSSFFEEKGKEMEEMTVSELKKELQRVMDALVVDDDDCDLGFTDDAVQALYGLREIKLRQEPPQHFLCPISGTFIKYPVVAASGQTFENENIQKWLKDGNRKCPKTDEQLSHGGLIENHLIKKMIEKWCKASLVDPPSGGLTGDEEFEPNATAEDLIDLLQDLPSSSLSGQMAAVKELRMLTARQPSFRALFGEMSGAISQLLSPFMIETYYSDAALYNDAVATVLNISTEYCNKRKIVEEGPSLISFLTKALLGEHTETRGYAAGALSALSTDYSNKSVIGESGALKPLIKLLEERHPWGSREAASAVFNLCTRHENRERVLYTGGLTAVMDKLNDPLLYDEVLEILALFTSHPRPLEEMEKHGVLPLLFSIMEQTKSERDKENSVAIVRAMGISDRTRLKRIKQFNNSLNILYSVSISGTPRARRKANELLVMIIGKELLLSKVTLT